jgi:hypothetical protein
MLRRVPAHRAATLPRRYSGGAPHMTLLDRHVLGEPALRLIDDPAADGDVVRHGLICTHRRGRERPRVQEDRSLKRCWRWKSERSMIWVGHERRLLVRHDYSPRRFLAFIQRIRLHRVITLMKLLWAQFAAKYR